MQELAQKIYVEPKLAALTEVEAQVIELFVDLAEMIGYPRSVGQLYGMLFVSPDPMSMEHLISRLAISKGSASQGLKVLRTIGAVKTCYIHGDRRQHYSAEIAIRRIVTNFMRDQIGANLRNVGERLEAIQTLQDGADGESRTVFSRVDNLASWQKRAENMLPMILKLVDRG